MEAQLGELQRFAEEQRRLASALREQLEEIREEGLALQECLEAAGVLPQRAIRAVLGRRRSTAAMGALLQAPELVLAVGHCAGSAAVRALAVAARIHSRSVQPLLSDLLALLVPQVCIVGGSDG